MSVWAVVYDESGTQVGRLNHVLRARRARRVNQIGGFEVVVPATDEEASVAVIGYELEIYDSNSSNNPRGRGRIEEMQTLVRADGRHQLAISGLSLAVELANTPTYGHPVDDDTASNVASDLLDGASWAETVTGSGFVNLSNYFPAKMSIWEAMTWLRENQGAYIRETSTARTLELKRGTTSSGIRLRNAAAPPEGPLDAAVGLIKSIRRVRKDGRQIVNRVVPRGLNQGNLVFGLGYSNRSTGGGFAYDISSLVPTAPKLVATAMGKHSGSGTGMFQGSDAKIRVIGPNSLVLVVVETFLSGSAREIVDLSVGGRSAAAIFDGDEESNQFHWAAFWVSGLPPGEHDIQISWDDDNNRQSNIMVASFKDAHQTDPIRDYDEEFDDDDSTPNPSTFSFTSDDDDLIVAFGSGQRTGSTTGITWSESLVEADERVFNPTGSVYMIEGVATKAGDGCGGSSDFAFDDASAFAWWAHAAFSIKAQPVSYVEDTTSIAAYGGPNGIPRVEFMDELATQLVGASATQLQNAANSLYDRAVDHLTKRKDEVTYYEGIDCELADDSWNVGDSFPVKGSYVVEDAGAGRRGWLSIDATLYALEAVELWDGDGIRRWELLLATAYDWPQDDQQVFTETRGMSQASAGVVVSTA